MIASLCSTFDVYYLLNNRQGMDNEQITTVMHNFKLQVKIFLSDKVKYLCLFFCFCLCLCFRSQHAEEDFYGTEEFFGVLKEI